MAFILEELYTNPKELAERERERVSSPISLFKAVGIISAFSNNDQILLIILIVEAVKN